MRTCKSPTHLSQVPYPHHSQEGCGTYLHLRTLNLAKASVRCPHAPRIYLSVLCGPERGALTTNPAGHSGRSFGWEGKRMATSLACCEWVGKNGVSGRWVPWHSMPVSMEGGCVTLRSRTRPCALSPRLGGRLPCAWINVFFQLLV